MPIKTINYMDFPEQASVSENPAASTQRMYFKDDHKLYKRDSSGSESEISGSGGTGWTEATAFTTDDTETSLFTVSISTDNTVTFVKALVVAIISDGSSQLSAEITYSAYRNGGGATELMGTNILASNTWDETIFQKCEFDCDTNDIRLRIQGKVATDTDWKVLYMTTSLSPSA